MKTPRSNKTRGEIRSERILLRNPLPTPEEQHCSHKAMLLYKMLDKLKYNENVIAELLTSMNNNYLDHLISDKTQRIIKELKDDLNKAYSALRRKHSNYQLMLMDTLRTCGKNKVLPLP